MTVRWVAFGLWAAVAASAVYWGLKLFVPGLAVPAQTTVASLQATPRGDLSRLLGADEVPVVAEAAPDPRFHLIGVVAPRAAGAAREGLALIAVDDKPARAYRVGAVVDGDTVLQEVHARSVALGPRDGPVRVSLDIPPPPPASTGAVPVPAPYVAPPALPPRPANRVQRPDATSKTGPHGVLPTR